MVAVSNEAEELHKMCDFFKRYSTSNPATSTTEALASMFEVVGESAEYFAFISAVRLRFERFLIVVEKFVQHERHRANLRAAVKQLATFTECRYWQSPWRDTKNNAFNDIHLMALDMAGAGLTHVAPVTILDADERNACIDDLRSALAEIAESEDFLAQMFSQSIRTAIKMIELFDVFGSAAISEHLFKTHAIAKEAAEVAPQGRRSSYTKAAVIVAAVLGAMIYADSAVTAVENFYTRAGEVGKIIGLAQPAAQKLLPAPSDPARQDQPEDTDSEAEKQIDV